MRPSGLYYGTSINDSSNNRNHPARKWRLACKADNLTAIYDPIAKKMWEHQHLTILWLFKACCRDSYTFFFNILNLQFCKCGPEAHESISHTLIQLLEIPFNITILDILKSYFSFRGFPTKHCVQLYSLLSSSLSSDHSDVCQGVQIMKRLIWQFSPALCIFLLKTPWPDSASELYRPSDHQLSAKLVPTFAARKCYMVSVTDPQGCILGFLDRVSSSCLGANILFSTTFSVTLTYPKQPAKLHFLFCQVMKLSFHLKLVLRSRIR
jgi:hypothetical protein